jgi:hypothetical protein
MRRIELSLLFAKMTTLVTDYPSGLAPREVIEMPERVSWQDTVPYREGKEVDKHPTDVCHFARGYDNEDPGKAQDNSEQD